MGIDTENDLFRRLPQKILTKIERSVYNRRQPKLADNLNSIRLKLAYLFNEFEDYFVVDSMPLEVCKLSRSSRSKIVKKMIMHFQIKTIVQHRVLIITVINYTLFVL